MSINQQQYIEMRERVEDLLCRLSSTADTLQVIAAALSRPRVYKTTTPVRTIEDPAVLESCAQVARKAAQELREHQEQMLRTIPEVLPCRPAA